MNLLEIDYEFKVSIIQTMIMVIIPTIISFILGIFLGSILFLTKKDGVLSNKIIYSITNLIINIVRSMPFIIFVVILIPLTRKVFGTAFGVIPASFPICFIGTALYSRFVEQSFLDVNPKMVDLAKSMRANPFQIIYHFMIVESRSSLVLGLTSCMISIISYSTVMGIVGGGGIGDYAIRHGYYEYDYNLIYKALVIMMIIVFIIQYLGNKIANKLDKK